MGGLDGYPEGPCHGGPYISVESVLADIKSARAALMSAPVLVLHAHLCDWHAAGHRLADDCLTAAGTEYSDAPCYEITVRDMRGTHVHGLPDAGTRYSIPYVADGLPGPDGRRKIVCSGDAETIRAFRDWANHEGLVDAYGDPERGFAGAYSTVTP